MLPKLLYRTVIGNTPVNVRDAELSSASAYFHVTVPLNGPQAPVMAALTREGLEAGNRIDPDDWWEVRSTAAGIWVVGPKDGGDARVQVERRMWPTQQSRSERGRLVTTTAWKSTDLGVVLAKEKWETPWSNVLGLVGGVIRARGGTVWIGTHCKTGVPPPPTEDAMASSGGAFPIRDGDPPLHLPGNPGLCVFTYEDGVVLHLLKIGGGREFGDGAWTLKAE